MRNRINGIAVDMERATVWQPQATEPPRQPTPEETQQQLARQAEAAKRFHHRARLNDKDAIRQARRRFVSQLSYLGLFVYFFFKPIVWLTAHINIKGQWMMLNADRVASFVRTHLKGPVWFTTCHTRRVLCQRCEFRRDRWCNVSTCNCGEHVFSTLKHVTRLSGIACPKGKWSHGMAHRLIEHLKRRKDV